MVSNHTDLIQPLLSLSPPKRSSPLCPQSATALSVHGAGRVDFTGHWSVSEFCPEQYKQGQRSTGLEVFLLCVFEQRLQLVKYSLGHSKCAELRLCPFISCMTTLLSH